MDAMNCEQVNELLELFALGELDRPARLAVEDHLAGCAECRSAVEDSREVLAALRGSAEPPAVSERFAQAVAVSAGGEILRARRRRRLSRTFAAAGPVAAAAMIALAVLAVWRQHANRPPLADGPNVAPLSPPLAAAPLTERWQRGGALAAQASPADGFVLHGRAIYLLIERDRRSVVAALDAETGRPRWRSAVASLGHLAADDERVYCLSDSPPAATPGRGGRIDLVALDAASGAELWRRPQDHPERLGDPAAPVALGDGRVCWSTNTTVAVLDGRTGRPIWAQPIGDEGLISGATPAGDALCVATSAALYGLSPDDGRVRWRDPLGPGATTLKRPLLAADADGVFVAQAMRDQGDQGSRVVRVAAAGQRVAWQRDVPLVFHLLARDGRLYLRAPGRVTALSAGDGQPMWTCEASGCSPLTGAGGTIYFIDTADAGRLVAIDVATGRPAWRLDGIQSCNAFVPADGAGYLKTRDGVLHALARADSPF